MAKKKYTVSLKVELRFDVKVEAESFEEAFSLSKEKGGELDLNHFESWVETSPVNATRDDGVGADYGIHPYPDNEVRFVESLLDDADLYARSDLKVGSKAYVLDQSEGKKQWLVGSIADVSEAGFEGPSKADFDNLKGKYKGAFEIYGIVHYIGIDVTDECEYPEGLFESVVSHSVSSNIMGSKEDDSASKCPCSLANR